MKKLGGTAASTVGVDCRHASVARPRPDLEAVPLALLRQSLAWAALAAFHGSAVGLAATFSSSRAVWAGCSGSVLAALSLFGVASLLGRGRSRRRSVPYPLSRSGRARVIGDA